MRTRLLFGWCVFGILALLTVWGNLITEFTDPLDRQLIGDNQYVQNNYDHPGVPAATVELKSKSVKAMLGVASKVTKDLQEALGNNGVVQSLWTETDPLTFARDPQPGDYKRYATEEMLHLGWSEGRLQKRYKSWQTVGRSVGGLACSASPDQYCTTVLVTGRNISETELGWIMFRTMVGWVWQEVIIHYKRFWKIDIDASYTEYQGNAVDIDLVGWPFVRLMISIVSEIDIYIIIPVAMVLFSALIVVRPALRSGIQTGIVVGLTLFLLLFSRALIGLWALIMTHFGWNDLTGLHPLEDVFDIRERAVVIVLGTSFFLRRFRDFNQSDSTQEYFSRWKGSISAMVFVAVISIASFACSGAQEVFADEKLRSAIQVNVIAALATGVTLAVALYFLPIVYYPWRNRKIPQETDVLFSKTLNSFLERVIYLSVVWNNHRRAGATAIILLLASVITAGIGFHHGALVIKGAPIEYAHGTWPYTHAQERMTQGDTKIGPTGYEVFVEADVYDPKQLCEMEKYSDYVSELESIFTIANPFLMFADYVLEGGGETVCATVQTRYDAQTYWGELRSRKDSYVFGSAVILPDANTDEKPGIRIYFSGKQLATEEIEIMRDKLVAYGIKTSIRPLNADKISEFVEVERHYTYKRIIEDAVVSIAVIIIFAFIWFWFSYLRQQGLYRVWSGLKQSITIAVIIAAPFVFAQAGTFLYMMVTGTPYDIGTAAINDVAVSAAADLPAFPVQVFLVLFIGVASFSDVMRSDAMHEELWLTVLDALNNGSQFILLAAFASILTIERFGTLLSVTMVLCIFAVLFISLPLLRFVRK